jgi:hypothetical protein
VICASAEESSGTAVEAARVAWNLSHIMKQEDVEHIMTMTTVGQPPLQDDRRLVLFHRLQKLVKTVRPVIESGFENVLLARYFHDQLTASDSRQDEGMDDRKDIEIAETMMKTWSPTVRDELLSHYGLDRPTLVQIFGHTRDLSIAKDLSSWARRNQIYQHVQDVFQAFTSQGHKLDLSRTFIVTTKQERFVKAILTEHDKHSLIEQLLRRNADSSHLPRLVSNSDAMSKTMPLDQVSNVFDLENIYGHKANVLKALLERSQRSAAIARENESEGESALPRIHFVEDRLETLLKIVKLRQEDRERYRELDRVALYLVDWGYNTAEQRMLVSSHGHPVLGSWTSPTLREGEITLLTPSMFLELLQGFIK